MAETLGDGGERGHQKVLEASGAPVHLGQSWAVCPQGLQAGDSLSKWLSSPAPGQFPQSLPALAAPQACGAAPAARSPRGGGGKTTKRQPVPASVRPDGAGGPRGGPLCSGAQWQPGIIHQTEGPIEILTRRGPGGRDFPGLASWLRAVPPQGPQGPKEDHAEVWSLPQGARALGGLHGDPQGGSKLLHQGRRAAPSPDTCGTASGGLWWTDGGGWVFQGVPVQLAFCPHEL